MKCLASSTCLASLLHPRILVPCRSSEPAAKGIARRSSYVLITTDLSLRHHHHIEPSSLCGQRKWSADVVCKALDWWFAEGRNMSAWTRLMAAGAPLNNPFPWSSKNDPDSTKCCGTTNTGVVLSTIGLCEEPISKKQHCQDPMSS